MLSCCQVSHCQDVTCLTSRGRMSILSARELVGACQVKPILPEAPVQQCDKYMGPQPQKRYQHCQPDWFDCSVNSQAPDVRIPVAVRMHCSSCPSVAFLLRFLWGGKFEGNLWIIHWLPFPCSSGEENANRSFGGVRVSVLGCEGLVCWTVGGTGLIG